LKLNRTTKAACDPAERKRGMQTTTYTQYLEAEVMGADPVKLVYLLYRGAIDAVGAARRHLATGDIGQRSRQIQKAWDILQELLQALDRERGGELGVQLAVMYIYMQNRLIRANSQQCDAPLAEVETLLGTLAEAWRSLQTAVPKPATAAKDYQPVSCSY
jgi:flagellar secretion chaperone FliS